MSAANQSRQEPIAAFVGIDWADEKHDIALRAAEPEAKVERTKIANQPEALSDWVLALRERFKQGKILICLEQSRGALIHFLMGYDCFELYPLTPNNWTTTARLSGPAELKMIPPTGSCFANTLVCIIKSCVPGAPTTSKLVNWHCFARSAARPSTLAALSSNQLKSELKEYYPLALAALDNDLTTVLAADFLLKWPNFASLKKASAHKLRSFFYGHQCRSEQKIEARIQRIQSAQPLTRDSAIIEAGTLPTQMLARQLQALAPFIRQYDQQIAELFSQHPDRALFDNLPGAGDALAPRLLSAFGSERDRFDKVLEPLSFFGIAPVTERSGKTTFVHFRWACSKFLRQTFHEFAGCSVHFCDWAAAFYNQQRARGKDHHAAVRALAYKWIRILFRCWKTRQPYDPQRYLTALAQHRSPLASSVKNSP